MSYLKHEISDNVQEQAEVVRPQLHSAVGMADKSHDGICNYLAAIVKRSKDVYGHACNRAAKESRIANGVLHENLYQTVLIGIGVGVILGGLIAKRCAINDG